LRLAAASKKWQGGTMRARWMIVSFAESWQRIELCMLGRQGLNLRDKLRSLSRFLHAKVLLEGWSADRRAKDNDSFGLRCDEFLKLVQQR
jgi:hypothetical protein